jgi:hypothetical protein
MRLRHSLLRGLSCAVCLLACGVVAAEITYSGDSRRATRDSGGTGGSDFQRRDDGDRSSSDARRERHLRHPMQTSPDRGRTYGRERPPDDFRRGYRQGYRDGYRDDGGGFRDGRGYAPGAYGGYGGYGYDRPSRYGGAPPYGYSPYRGGVPGYASPPTRRYPSVPQPLSPYRR